jgi:WXG100 family type VII secretion target
MPDLTIRCDDLADAGGVVSSVAADLTDELNLLDDRSAQLTGQWSGEAQVAYVDQYQGWARQMRELAETLDDAGAAAAKAAAAYRAADEQVGRLWGL